MTAQAQNIVSSVSQPNSNWEEPTASNQALKEAANSKRVKLSCVLNLLKDALAEEFQISQLLKESAVQDKLMTSMKNIIEDKHTLVNTENQLERPSLRSEKESNSENAVYQNVMMKMQSALSNNEYASNDIEMPTMIPIFRQRSQAMPRKELNHTLGELSSTSKTSAKPQISKSKAVSFLPEKLIQTNLNPIPGTSVFSIPCQRAADVLDMNIAPKEAVCKNVQVNSKLYPIANEIIPSIPNQLPAPVTISCADEDDTIAMLFKPKNISLQQIHGNLMKKVTITVLVPYHMSKLGEK